jgi:two-component SAPR family response regulator
MNDYDPNDPACSYMDLTNVYKTFSSVISKYDNITHIRKTSDDAIDELKDIKVDLIYIDGLHTYDQVKKDIDNYIGLINESGFISGHDYHSVWQGVIDAIHEKIGKPDTIFQDTSWIKKLNK